jgi:UDP-N-acetylmuramoyl-L-alanyl-D-glutamate--2,6-diaminopimelate ligase
LKLIELIGGEPALAGDRAPHSPEIAGITADSRAVRPGFLFAALPGTCADGRRFAAEAAARGAAAILTNDKAALDLPPEACRRIAILVDPNPRRRLALLAARFYGVRPETTAAVTGTNGKTSVVHFTREIWSAVGHAAASLGTLGLVTPSGRRTAALTTPDPAALHQDLAALVAEGVTHLAIEASSHGLAQFRLDGLSIAAAAFTNLTRDHLDYHSNMADYRAAKERLFADLLGPGRPAVLNPTAPRSSTSPRRVDSAAIRSLPMVRLHRLSCAWSGRAHASAARKSRSMFSGGGTSCFCRCSASSRR